jgi:cation diffusion facilitator CzcD-associated flavoprotein CzcO
MPEKSLAVLEARDGIGGTWDHFRYPGIRSDSDMFTLGYDFEPWPSPLAIADGPSIREYVRNTADKYGVTPLVRFGHKVISASWSSRTARWTITYAHAGQTGELTCSMLWGNTGYFDHEKGYTPDFAGMSDFRGTIIHPQEWPEDFDYSGKRVVVIGSGATAVTLVPAMADKVEHITMLQRSPSYLMAVPWKSPFAGPLQKLLPTAAAHKAATWAHWAQFQMLYTLSQRRPAFIRRQIRKDAVRRLPEGYDVDRHFNPAYDPWDQRMCFIPGGDFFKAVSAGKASVVTDRIDRFTETGIRLESGEELRADVIVTATGFTMLMGGGIEIEVDGEPFRIHDAVLYKGLMLSGMPNFVMSIGYTNASFTLKVNLTGDYMVRLLKHMDETGMQIVTPLAPPDGEVGPLALLSAGYFDRAADILPMSGAKDPWALYMFYPKDRGVLRRRPIADEGVRFARATPEVDAVV